MKINVINPPDNVFNFNPGFLLVNPSVSAKATFHQIVSQLDYEVNVFIYEQEDNDIAWLLGVSQNCDMIIIDIDHCSDLTKLFVSLLLINPRSVYLTQDDKSPWSYVNRNRIFDMGCIVERLFEDEDYDDEELDDDE